MVGSHAPLPARCTCVFLLVGCSKQQNPWGGGGRGSSHHFLACRSLRHTSETATRQRQGRGYEAVDDTRGSGAGDKRKRNALK
jgi:hypothetical protein